MEQVAIELRDRLIAAQETLLNRFRCRFGIDVSAVRGGCVDGVPVVNPHVVDPAAPAAFIGVPTRAEVAQRDQLVAAQEALLNAYRCLFDIDVAAVPGGCPV